MKIRALGIGLACLLGACGEQGPRISPPVGSWGEPAPVLFVLVDTLRADHTSISQHREGRDTTPFLRKLAGDSFVFERAYANASWTRASMATIFSSRLPSSHGCETRHGVLVDEVITWPEVLQENGWHTRAVVTNGNVDARFGFDQGFDDFQHIIDWPRSDYADGRHIREPTLTAIDRIGDDLGALWLHYVDPHDPYLHHEDADFLRDPLTGVGSSQERLFEYSWAVPEDESIVREVVDLYDGEILWWDRQLEELCARLELRGWLDRAWIVITSDHGEGLWDHRTRAHGQALFEEQVKVPLLVRPPGGLSRRVDVADPIGLIDLGPTLLELLGQRVPAEFEGESWAAYLEGRASAPTRPVILEERLDQVELLGIIDGDDKLISTRRKTFGTIKLYDLSTNPGEERRFALDQRAERTPIGTRLQRLLDEAVRDAQSRRPSGTQTGLEGATPEQIAQLKALGYLGDSPELSLFDQEDD